MTIKCPICDSTDVRVVFSADNQPLARYGLCDTITETHSAGSLALSMTHCESCGVLFNYEFRYSDVNYRSKKIQESRIFSPRIREYMINTAESLKQRFDIRNMQILEVGCGEGFFLGQLMNDATCVGFEPSPEGTVASSRGIRVIPEYFDPNKKYDLSPSLIILRQVLEHLTDPRSYLKAFVELLSNGMSPGYIYIEVPNGNATIDNLRFYDFYYEHYLHFTTGSLVKLLEISGFRVIECAERFNGEILSIIGRPYQIRTENKSFEQSMKSFARLIDSRLTDGKTVVAWGTAGNGCSFLNLCGIGTDKIEYVIDSDERKQNLFVPGTGQRVVSPDYFAQSPPDVIIILSQFHKDDILNQIRLLFSDKVEIITIDDKI